MKILLLSDTHSYLDDAILKHCHEADEIWHAGDFGNVKVSDTLSFIKPLRGVYGNIDGQELRKVHPLESFFIAENVPVLMIHIGGYPGAWPPKIKTLIQNRKPALFICGHSHILKIVRDPEHNQMLCINPGASGRVGFHQKRTMVRMVLNNGKVDSLEVIELGSRTS